MKIIYIAFAGLMATMGLASCSTPAANAAPAAIVNLKTIASIYQDKSALSGKTVSAQGKVVSVNNDIMRRNFLHIQDGTGDATSNDLVVTSQQTANVGDQVTISGVVILNRDFGSGYSYPLLIEDASITPRK